MDKLEQRERAFENKFAHDAEIEFKIKAKSYKLLGLWLAQQLNISENQRLEYALKLVDYSITNDDIKINELINHDYNEYNLEFDQSIIKEKLKEFQQQAQNEVSKK